MYVDFSIYYIMKVGGGEDVAQWVGYLPKCPRPPVSVPHSILHQLHKTHTCNSSIQEVGSGKLEVQAYLGLQIEFEVSLASIRASLKRQTKQLVSCARHLLPSLMT